MQSSRAPRLVPVGVRALLLLVQFTSGGGRRGADHRLLKSSRSDSLTPGACASSQAGVCQGRLRRSLVTQGGRELGADADDCVTADTPWMRVQPFLASHGEHPRPTASVTTKPVRPDGRYRAPTSPEGGVPVNRNGDDRTTGQLAGTVSRAELRASVGTRACSRIGTRARRSTRCARDGRSREEGGDPADAVRDVLVGLRELSDSASREVSRRSVACMPDLGTRRRR